MLHQQRIADQLQHALSVSSGLTVIRQFPGKGFDDLEHFRDFALVIGQHDTLRQHVGDNQQPFRRHIPQLNRPARLDLIVGLIAARDKGGFFLEPRELAADPGRQFGQERGFIFRRKPDQHRDAVAKQHRDARLADLDGKRHRRQGVAFKTPGVDAVADMQRVRCHPRAHIGRNEFGFGHHAVS